MFLIFQIEIPSFKLPHLSTRADAAVIYDDCFKKEFGRLTVTRVRAVMEIVNEMYSEKDSLETTIEWNIKKIIHKRGRNWCPVTDWNTILGGELQANTSLMG